MNSLTREILVAAREVPRLYFAPLVWIWRTAIKLARSHAKE
jgi:hypothetical protein